jgi:hypothetical protein
MEGRCYSAAHRGYSQDGRKGTLQIVYGLLCAPDGCPVAIEVLPPLSAISCVFGASSRASGRLAYHLEWHCMPTRPNC